MFFGNSFRRALNKYLFLSMFIIQASFTQEYGTVKGRVFDKSSKEELPAANIVIKGTGVGTVADLNGSFILRGAPSGMQTIIVSYLGYSSVSIPISIPEDGEIKQDFFLTPTALEGEEVIVTAQAQGQIQAINQQLQSNKISNVVSEAKIQELPDFNAAAAIGRLSGVSTLSSSGEANKVVIRGLAPQYNQITLGGVGLASTGSAQIGMSSQGGTNLAPTNDRSVDLSMVSPYMIQNITVYKALTPELNANSLGGTVNMELREAPSDFHSDILWQSGYTAKSKEYGNYRAVVSASGRFFDDQLGIYVLGNLESYDRNSDNMNAAYEIKDKRPDTTTGYRPIYTNSINLNRHIETRKREGANVILDARLPFGSIKFVNMFSRLNSDYKDYRTIYDYQYGDLSFRYNAGKNNVDLATNSIALTNDFGFISVDLKAVNNYSRNQLPNSPQFQFHQTSGVGSRPTNTRPENMGYLSKYGGDSLFYLDNLSLLSSDYKENGQTYKSDFKIPFKVGSDVNGYFKFGGEYKYTTHRNQQNTPYVDVRGATNGIQSNIIAGLRSTFPGLQNGYNSSTSRFYGFNFTSNGDGLLDPFLGDRFGDMLWVPNANLLLDMTNYVATNPHFSGDSATSIQPGGWFNGYFQTLPNTYKYIEKYYASYAMTELNYGGLMVVGGVRYEEVRSVYDAFNIADGRDQKSQKFFPVSSARKNHFLLPMVQAKYNITDWFDLRYAYTQTLARPDYHQISPHFAFAYSRDRVWAGNPNLKTAHSNNHDFIMTFHSNELGLLSIGGFYKTIKDFTYSTNYSLLDSLQPAGFDSVGTYSIGGAGPKPNGAAKVYTYINTPYPAYVKGLEFDFQTRLWYLPSPLSNILMGCNYTLITSSATYPTIDKAQVFIVDSTGVRRQRTFLVDSTRSGRLINQPNTILNAYVGYDYEGFSVRVSAILQKNAPSSIGNFPEEDGYTRDYFRVDASAKQLLPWFGAEVFLDINNLNNQNNSSAQKSLGGFTNEQNYGLTGNLGLRVKL